MISYALKRLLGAIPTLFFIITATFFMMRVVDVLNLLPFIFFGRNVILMFIAVG